MIVSGVNGSKSGWFVISRNVNTQELSSRIAPAAADVFSISPEPSVLAIDVPIGLPDSGSRPCDIAARSVLGPRASSVFPAPIRPLLVANSWEEACQIGARIEGRRISKQTWGIIPKIRQVDRLLQAAPDLSTKLREIHPEVCFWAWNGKIPMGAHKRTADGRQERLRLIETHFGPTAYAEIRCVFRKREAEDDDILDAFAALWTAERIAAAEASTLPPSPTRDSHGLGMEMVY